ncbi:MAG: DUF6049 family protein [Nocardioides sp.]
MTRRSPGRAAACLATGLLTALALLVSLPVLPAQAATGVTTAATAADGGPLKVSIDTLTPSVVPTRGVVRVTGEITNTTQQTWRDLTVYMLTSTTPMTSSDELAAASATDLTTEIGQRLYSQGLYARVGNLGPGQSVPYSLAVKRSALGIGTEPGVYWLGVHVLAQDPNGGRDSVADGRARTFLPLVPPSTKPRDLAVVMPVTAAVRRQRDGRLLGAAAWRRSFGPDGRLDRLVRLSGTTSGNPLTWLLDPAVVDAARSVAKGNTGFSVAPTDGSADPAASAAPSPTGGASPSGAPSAQPTPPVTPATSGATNWLQLLQRQAPDHTVLGLPYGDLDVASVFDARQRAVYTAARRQTSRALKAVNIGSQPVVAPASGLLPASALHRLAPTIPVLMSDRAFPASGDKVLSTASGGRVALTDSAASSSGPSPADRWSALAVRQRILSEAALRTLTPGPPQPVVVRLPQHWNPGPHWAEADFFGGLAVPWLHLVDLPSVTSAKSAPPASGAPVYPRAEARAAVPFANLLATQELIHTGATFASLLTRNDTVDDDLARIGLLGSSTQARAHPDAALERVRNTTGYVRHLMEKVQIEGPQFVTMSSAEGPIQITVVNGLDEEVTVSVRALTRTSDVTIQPTDPITLGPGKRASLRLSAHARGVGVHAVTLVASDAAGEPLGSTTQFTVRTSQVGLVIWAIMAVGGAVLAAAIVLRTVRRIQAARRRRARPATDPTPSPSDGGTPAAQEQA